MNNTLFKLVDVSKVYNSGVVALKNINLEINSGEFISITGPSGSGKTTLLNIIGLLDSHTSGEFFFKGKKINNPVVQYKLRSREVGFIFQLFYLMEHLTVIENCEIPMIPAGVDKSKRLDRSMELIEKVGLSHKTNQMVNTLSGGEKQRVAIARALANDPSVILADEPTGNLDSATGNSIMEILKELNEKENKTVIVVTHDNEISKASKKEIRLKDGMLLANNQQQIYPEQSRSIEK